MTGATANEAERLKTKNYERYHHEGRIVPIAQDFAGALADGHLKLSILFIMVFRMECREDGSVSRRESLTRECLLTPFPRGS
jgi:hypothetical protein